jgi:hypothetical protein
MRPQTQAELDLQIVDDLMKKVADDIERAIKRSLDIAPEPRLPIAVQAASTAVGELFEVLRGFEGSPLSDLQLVMLAALLAGRGATVGEYHAALVEAKEDLCALYSAGRIE